MAAQDGSTEGLDLESMFGLATEYVRQYNGQFDTKNLLLFYGRFKQAKEGKCNISKPGFFDFQGKSKWDAWNHLGDMSQSQAMAEYVALLSDVNPDWLSKMKAKTDGSNAEEDKQEESSHGRKQGLGVSVSVLANTEGELREDEKTVFDWCKEGNVSKVKDILLEGQAKVNGLDEDGLSLLHWASDRGLKEMVEMLLSLDADINIQDEDQQTALHYAVSCEHPEVMQVLIQQGINQSLKDVDGNTATDIASDEIKILITKLTRGS